MLNPTKDAHYAKIVRSKDRAKMYKYRLIRSIIQDLDEYLTKNKLTSINDESSLLIAINVFHRKHTTILTKYFKVSGYTPNVTINTSDIEDWTFKYNHHHKLYIDNNDKLTYA